MATSKKNKTTKKSGGGSSAAKKTTTTRRRNTSGVKDIPAAMMTVGIVAANAAPITTAISSMSLNGLKNAATQAIQPAQLKKTAAYALGGAVAGYAVKKFAPKFIRQPLGMVAKKIKGVF